MTTDLLSFLQPALGATEAAGPRSAAVATVTASGILAPLAAGGRRCTELA